MLLKKKKKKLFKLRNCRVFYRNKKSTKCVDRENLDTIYECKGIMIADFLISIPLNMDERMY